MNTLLRSSLLAIASTLLAANLAMAGPQSSSTATPPASPQQLRTVAQAVDPSLVRVEYNLQFDKGEAPRVGGAAQRCPSCGRFHGGGDQQSLVVDERPLEMPGFLVAADSVVVVDPIVQPRFIKSIVVRKGDETRAATLAAVCREQPGVFLRLESPFGNAKPLEFHADAPGPFFAVTYSQGSADWVVAAQPAGSTLILGDSGRDYLGVPAPCVIADATGRAVGVALASELPANDSWKGSPTKWPAYSTADLERIAAMLRERVEGGIALATLNFRSPRADSGSDMSDMYMGRMGREEESTVQYANGLLIGDRQAVILANMKPKRTARLESIRVSAGGKTVNATFDRTLKDFGAIIVKLDEPLPGALTAADTSDPLALRDVALPSMEVLLQGEVRTLYPTHARIGGYSVGFKRLHDPDVSSEGEASLFAFNERGELIMLPIARRRKGDDGSSYAYRAYAAPSQLLAGYLWPAVNGDPTVHGDPNNVPLSEEAENRLAWMGVELQALDSELARVNGVSDVTSDGETGALVTYVYPGSPAEAAGIQVGQVLLRIHSPEHPQPIDVQPGYSGYGDQPYPWDRFDELPEQYFDRLPKPWPEAENPFTRAITDLGFGQAFDLEMAVDGKVTRKEFKVIEGPKNYETAAKLKFEPLGTTLRELTYEVRRYFQLPEDEPGLIISKIEIGSKASTSGLKPFEIITHVNGEPVSTVKEFEERTKGQSNLHMSVLRMTKSRQVNINVDASKGAEATKPAAAGQPSAPGDAQSPDRKEAPEPTTP